MTTISTAVQGMVNNLASKMQSGTPYTAEEQLLVAKAVTALQDNQTWEQAVVAVVEQHLNTATGALSAAQSDINLAKTSIESKTANLDLIAGLRQSFQADLDKLSDKVQAKLGSLNRNYVMSPACDVLLRNAHNSNYFTYLVHNLLQIDDYSTGNYYCLYDYGNKTSSATQQVLLKIDRKGKVFKAVRNAPIATTGKWRFVTLDDGSCRVLYSNEGSTYLMSELAFSWQYNSPNDFEVWYQDKETKTIYTVNSGVLLAISSKGIAPDSNTTFINQDVFKQWAEQKGYILLDGFIGYSNTHTSTSRIIISDNGYTTHLAYLSPRAGVSQRSLLTYSSEQGYRNLPAPVTSNMYMSGQQVNDNDSGNKTVPQCYKGTASFEDKEGYQNRLEVELLLPWNGYSKGNLEIYHPQYIAFSHQHQALIFNATYRTYISTSSLYYLGVTGISFAK